MTDVLYLNPDVLLQQRDARWLASNPRLRTHVELEPGALAALAPQAAGGSESDWACALQAGRGRDATTPYFGAAGLHADHSGIAAPDARGPWQSGATLRDLLRRHALLIASRAEAQARLAPLDNPLDRNHLGNFHQRVGQYLLLARRERQPWRAWQNQKFTPAGDALLPGNYLQVQQRFFDQQFATGLAGKRVLDFGCGNGYFSARFARLGAHVLGLDSSAELLALAQHNHGDHAQLQFAHTADFAAALTRLDAEARASYDLVYLQDTLLLLIAPEHGQPDPLLPALLAAFARLLRPGGRLCAMEPNPVFWLASRYGDPQAPYAVVSEYRHPLFNVAPTLERMLPVLTAGGFALADFRHPPAGHAEGGEPAHPDYPYIAEFPIWDFFSFVPCPTS